MRVLLFGDTVGIPQLLKCLHVEDVCGIVAAEIRPQYIEPMEQIAHRYGVSFRIQPKNRCEEYPKFLKWVKGLHPDIGIVNSYSMKLHHDLLAIPNRESVNVHGGLLPQYQGANPIQWSIINGEKDAGVTMHYMNDNIDGGDIIAQKIVSIDIEDTWVEVFEKIQKSTCVLLARYLPLLLRGNIERYPQNPARIFYRQRRTPEDGLISWDKPVEEIYNLIRALVTPLPGAFYYDGGSKIVLDKFLTLKEVADLKKEICKQRVYGNG